MYNESIPCLLAFSAPIKCRYRQVFNMRKKIKVWTLSETSQFFTFSENCPTLVTHYCKLPLISFLKGFWWAYKWEGGGAYIIKKVSNWATAVLLKIRFYFLVLIKDVRDQNVPTFRLFWNLSYSKVKTIQLLARRKNKECHLARFREKTHWSPCVFRSFRYFETMLAYNYQQLKKLQ